MAIAPFIKIYDDDAKTYQPAELVYANGSFWTVSAASEVDVSWQRQLLGSLQPVVSLPTPLLDISNFIYLSNFSGAASEPDIKMHPKIFPN